MSAAASIPNTASAPSPKVIADGQPVPKGGGREMVGKPYTIAGRTYVPSEAPRANEGLASWYGSSFHGRMTANGEIFDRDSIAAAHTTMPLPSYARVTNLQNGHSMIVRVNDRGPFHGNRVIDVSERAASALGFRQQGTARVRVEYVGRASTNGSDDRILLASLRTDGQPATMIRSAPTMIAQAAPQANAPRQAIALRSYEPDSAAYATPARPIQTSAIGRCRQQRPASARAPIRSRHDPGGGKPRRADQRGQSGLASHGGEPVRGAGVAVRVPEDQRLSGIRPVEIRPALSVRRPASSIERNNAHRPA